MGTALLASPALTRNLMVRPLRHALAVGRDALLRQWCRRGLSLSTYLHIRGIAGQLGSFPACGQRLLDVHSQEGRDGDRFDVRPLADDQYDGIALFSGLTLLPASCSMTYPAVISSENCCIFLRRLHSRFQIILLVQLFQQDTGVLLGS